MSALTRVLEINPNHADAHTALGLYHSEIIDKIGKFIGGERRVYQQGQP